MIAPARVRYYGLMCDSARWDGFRLRDDDIIISTPPKCGTTWMQMICALLIFQTPKFAQPLDQITPWLDQLTRSREEVFATYQAQQHRRFIKTHTPLDGLPFDPRVTYICVARDPRDVAISQDNHIENMNMDAVMALRERAVGLDDLETLTGPPERPQSQRERFWQWVEELDVPLRGLKFMLHHVETFWNVRHSSNVVMVHYASLKADLEGQMRSLASLLGIEVAEGLWPALVQAATFENMRSRAADFAPNASNSLWRDTDRFFHRGTSGQWREMLDDDDLVRYERRVRALASPDLTAWIHQGAIRA